MGVRAQAKLLLFGEHAVVQGYPAVGLGLPLSLRLDWEQASEWVLPNLEEPYRTQALEVISLLIAQRPPEIPAGRLVFHSDIPLESGFGSSAAFCSALVKLFYPSLELHEQWELALHAEHFFHGRSSGVDVALAMKPGLWWFQRTHGGLKLEAIKAPRLVLLMGSLKRQTTAKNLIMGIHQQAQAGQAWVQHRLEELGQASQVARFILERTPFELGQLGNLAKRTQKILEELGLGHPAWNKLVQTAERYGSLGGKWSGAGGGGAFWFLFPDQASSALAAKSLSNAEGISWLLKPQSLTLEYQT